MPPSCCLAWGAPPRMTTDTALTSPPQNASPPTGSKPRAIQWEDIRLPAWVTGAIGGIGVIAIWWILAATVFSSVGPGGVQALPTPPQVLVEFVETGWDFFCTTLDRKRVE